MAFALWFLFNIRFQDPSTLGTSDTGNFGRYPLLLDHNLHTIGCSIRGGLRGKCYGNPISLRSYHAVDQTI
ncbi:hypothetical protein B0J14DRAFT_604606 [Halenospora varia]|nr:hypothetical protein B0J14DRAFT_604606 [Halenospora varia]